MFLLDFMRYFRGYVRFTAQGGFIERFLNLLARDRIATWDGRKRDDLYTGCVDIKNYRRLRKHARKTGVRVRIAEKRGVPFKRYRYRHRHGILAGLALFFAFTCAMSMFIWRVEVNGNETVSESMVVQVLEQLGIAPGTLRSSIDVRDSERRTLLLLRELSWVALNIEGSTIYVEVGERTEPPFMVDPHKPCNIVAAASGQITSLDVLDGQALVRPGDTVAEGDVIVSGIMQDRQGQNLFKHAQARAIATIDHRIQVEVPYLQTRYVETGGTRDRTYWTIAGFQLPVFLPFSIPHPYLVEREEGSLRLFSLELPVSVLRERYTLMEEVPVTLTKEEAKEKAVRELAVVEGVQLNGAEIFDKTLTAKAGEESYILRADYLCSMDIAREKEILLEDSLQQN